MSSLHQSVPVALQNARIAIIAVSNGAKIIQALTSSPTNLSVVKSTHTQPRGLCTFGRGIEIASALFNANGIKGVPQVLVVLLAGKSDDDVSKPSKDLQEAGVLVYTVGLSNMINQSSVTGMASDPVSEYFISSPGFPASGSTKQAILGRLDGGKSKTVRYYNFHLNYEIRNLCYSRGRWLLKEMYFCKGYDYGETVDLSKASWNPK